jgi:uncharacterized protein (TIGR02145 family)
MMQYATTQGIQGICPDGWHLPTDEAWKILEGTVDSQYGVGNPEWDNIGLRGFDAGYNLKSINSWYSNGNGSNTYSFTALPGGGRYGDGSFKYLGKNARFWTSSETDTNFARKRSLNYDEDGVFRITPHKSYGFSVRCMKD